MRTITALALAALAEAAYPYGIESFDEVLNDLWKGIRVHRGKVLAAFLKVNNLSSSFFYFLFFSSNTSSNLKLQAVGFIISLMDAKYAEHYTKAAVPVLVREFQSPDEEMKKIVLKVIKQCVATEGVEASYVRDTILSDFFRHFWVRRMALDRRNYKQVVRTSSHFIQPDFINLFAWFVKVETTVEIANKVGCAEVIARIVDDLKDESEPYRKMVLETIEQIVQNLGNLLISCSVFILLHHFCYFASLISSFTTFILYYCFYFALTSIFLLFRGLGHRCTAGRTINGWNTLRIS